jgi:hypothetical protein
VVQVFLAIVALTALPTVLFVSGQLHTDQVHTVCVATQKEWQTIHDVIVASEKPSAPSVDAVVIPEGTPPQVIEILRQISIAEHVPPGPDPKLNALGPEPTC